MSCGHMQDGRHALEGIWKRDGNISSLQGHICSLCDEEWGSDDWPENVPKDRHALTGRQAQDAFFARLYFRSLGDTIDKIERQDRWPDVPATQAERDRNVNTRM